MATLTYPKFKAAQAGMAGYPGPVDFDTDPLHILLVTGAYLALALATIKGHQFRADVAGQEVAAGGGYATGGLQLSGNGLVFTGDNVAWVAAAPSWPGATFTAAGAVCYKRVGPDLATPGDDVLINLLDFGGDKSAAGVPFTVSFDPQGVMLLM